jgi:hypothetical protein
MLNFGPETYRVGILAFGALTNLKILEWVSVSTGIGLLALSTFLYEDEDKRLQNYLEDAWVRLNDLGKRSIQYHQAFLHAVLDISDRALDYLFGERLCSWRAAAMSVALSCAITSALGAIFSPWQGPIPGEPAPHVMCILFLSFLAMYLVIIRELLGGRLTSKWALGFCVAPFAILWTLAMIKVYFVEPWIRDEQTPPGITSWDEVAINTMGVVDVLVDLSILCLAMFAAVLCDFVSIAANRRITKRLRQWRSSVWIVTAIAVNVAAASLFVLVPIRITEYLDTDLTSHGVPPSSKYYLVRDWFEFLGDLNWSVVLLSSLHVFLASAMAVHLALWPIICRPIYGMQRFGIATRKRVIALLGGCFIVAGLPGVKIILWAYIKMIG